MQKNPEKKIKYDWKLYLILSTLTFLALLFFHFFRLLLDLRKSKLFLAFFDFFAEIPHRKRSRLVKFLQDKPGSRQFDL